MRFRNLNISHMRNYKDNRHARAVKVSLNKVYGNTSSLNKELSKIITDFSHCCMLSGFFSSVFKSEILRGSKNIE